MNKFKLKKKMFVNFFENLYISNNNINMLNSILYCTDKCFCALNELTHFKGALQRNKLFKERIEAKIVICLLS